MQGNTIRTHLNMYLICMKCWWATQSQLTRTCTCYVCVEDRENAGVGTRCSCVFTRALMRSLSRASQVRRVHLIVNPFSGGKRAGPIVQDHVLPTFASAGVTVTIHTTRGVGDAYEFARTLELTDAETGEAYDAFVSVGGDGTTHEVWTKPCHSDRVPIMTGHSQEHVHSSFCCCEMFSLIFFLLVTATYSNKVEIINSFYLLLCHSLHHVSVVSSATPHRTRLSTE